MPNQRAQRWHGLRSQGAASLAIKTTSIECQNSRIIASVNHSPPRTPKGTRWGGRQKGTPNKLTAGVKDALRTAFTQAGGVEYLVGVAKAEPRVFCALLAKLLPSREELPAGGAPADLRKLSNEELEAKLALLSAKLNAISS